MKVSVTFFENNNYNPPFYNNIVESTQLYIGPDQTVKFTIQKKYVISENIESYKINISY